MLSRSLTWRHRGPSTPLRRIFTVTVWPWILIPHDIVYDSIYSRCSLDRRECFDGVVVHHEPEVTCIATM